jgi:hypothetical protein
VLVEVGSACALRGARFADFSAKEKDETRPDCQCSWAPTFILDLRSLEVFLFRGFAVA